MSMSISKEDGKRKTKGFPSIPFFFRTGNFLLDEREQECAFTLMTAYHEDVSALAKVFVASKKISYRLQLKDCNNSANCI